MQFIGAAHGRQRELGQLATVTLPKLSELPRPVPAPARAEPPPLPAPSRKAFGAVPAGTEEARALAKRAAHARWSKAAELKALQALGLKSEPELLLPYLADARAWAESELQRLAREVGGGVASPAVAALVNSSALAMAGSRAAYSAGNVQLGGKLAADLQRSILASHSLAVLEAKARIGSDPQENATQRALSAINSIDVGSDAPATDPENP